MKIVFKKIKWKNFLSTGNYWNEIELDTRENVLIYGENSYGKSTMLDALCFALYGKAFRNINKNNLINSINQKNCLVEVEFETSGKEYRILRGIKPNIFEIYCDETMIDQDTSTRDYQDILEKTILRLNYKSFTQIVILGSASFTPFMQLSAADRRNIIEDLLDIKIFSTMHDIVKAKIAANKDLVQTKKYSMELLNQKFDLTQKHLNESKIDIESECLKCETELLTIQSDISKLNIVRQNLKNKIAKYSAFVDKNQNIRNILVKLNKLKIQTDLSIAKLNSELNFFCENESCPTCFQAISPEMKNLKKDELTVKIATLNEDVNGINDKILKIQDNIAKLEKVESDLANIQFELREVDVMLSSKNSIMNSVDARKKTLYNNKSTVENNENDLNSIQAEIDVVSTEIEELLIERHHLDTAYLLLKDSGIKTKIIKQYLPIINKLINQYLSSLDFFVDFSFDETFKESIKSRHRDEFSYFNFSEGEKTKINLAILFTWRKLTQLRSSFDTNLLIMDEILDGALDFYGIDGVLSLLHNKNSEISVFVVSPKGDNYIEKFSKSIKFIKENGFSRIEN